MPAQDQALATAQSTLRNNMECIARTLGLTLGAAQDAGLAFRVGTCVPTTIAPSHNNRLVALLRIGTAARMPSRIWVSALSEAAGWGLAGERQRFVVVDGHFALLWTTPPLPESELMAVLFELFATAVALAEMAEPGELVP
jgi:hypothetical protein